MSAHEIAVRIAGGDWRGAVADPEAAAKQAAAAALTAAGPASEAFELSLLLADDATVRDLNRVHRGKDRPTDVLSFAAGGAPAAAGERALLGDVVLGFETCRRDAALEGKSLRDHISHLIVHGVLHLLGYDHETPAEARRMENAEAEILAGLGIADPYGVAQND